MGKKNCSNAMNRRDFLAKSARAAFSLGAFGFWVAGVLPARAAAAEGSAFASGFSEGFR